ncbi:MAG: LicD family protein [Magnetococcales bacterium]|nr:LicD family protein [Magnetococcales bacterium]
MGRNLDKLWQWCLVWLEIAVHGFKISSACRLFDKMFQSNLLKFQVIVAEPPFKDHIVLWGGVLLGWMREGRILPWDRDADFLIFDSERHLLPELISRLEAAGFELMITYFANDGVASEYSFVKGGRKFDLFIMKRELGMAQYLLFHRLSPKHPQSLITCAFPWHGTERGWFLGREWTIPARTDEHLASIYGQWRMPNPAYRYWEDDVSIISRETAKCEATFHLP